MYSCHCHAFIHRQEIVSGIINQPYLGRKCYLGTMLVFLSDDLSLSGLSGNSGVLVLEDTSIIPRMNVCTVEHGCNQHYYWWTFLLYQMSSLALNHHNTIYFFVHHDKWPLKTARYWTLFVNPMFITVPLHCPRYLLQQNCIDSLMKVILASITLAPKY